MIEAGNPLARRNVVAVLLKGYPRLSETFIAQEIRALEERGLDLRLVSLRHPTDRAVHPVHREIRSQVTYLPEYLWREPLRVWRAWRRMRRTPAYSRLLGLWLSDLRRDPTPNRGRRFGQALVLAAELPPEVSHIHAHFLHTPASVARYASLLTGLPWSCSAHAKDIWTTPDWEKREKLACAAWVVTCTAANREHLAALAPAGRVGLAYHGIDLRRFPPPPRRPPGPDGSDPSRPVMLVSVGRVVPKKGYDVLIEALALLPAGLGWRFVHLGGGPDLRRLKSRARALGLADRIDWRGPAPQEEVVTLLRSADLFVLASRIARDGDRDGLPNVLMEAQSQRLALVSTRISAIAELVEDGRTGRLVAADDVQELAKVLAALIADPAERARLGEAGLIRVTERFAMETGIDVVAARFGLMPDAAGRHAATRTAGRGAG
jgi:glycosyltransferase involved in cell wall biosynthesis